MFKIGKSEELVFCLVEGTKTNVVLDEHKCFILCFFFLIHSTTKNTLLLASVIAWESSIHTGKQKA